MSRRSLRAKPVSSRRGGGPKDARGNASALRSIVDVVDAVVVECDGGVIRAMNRVGRDLLGYTRQSPLGQPVATHFVFPSSGRAPARNLGKLVTARPRRLSLLTRAGKVIMAEARAIRLDKIANGRFLIFARPVADAAKTDKRILSLRSIIDALPDAILATDRQGKVRLANLAAARVLCCEASALVGQALAKFVPDWRGPGQKAGKSRLFDAVFGQTRDLIATRADGVTFPADFTLVPAESAKLLVAILRDSTARKASARAALSAAEHVAAEATRRAGEVQALLHQSQRIVEAASDGIVAVGLDGTIQSANRAAADMLNRDVRALIGLAVDRAFVHGAGAPTGTSGRPAPLRAQLWTGPHHVALETRLARSDGESFDAEYTIAPITEGRQTQGYVIGFRDITERKRADAEMRLSAAVFEHARDGLLITDARGRITKTNPAFCRITGFDSADVVGKPLAEMLFTDAKASPDRLDPLRTMTQTEWEQWSKNKAGKRYAARITMSVVRDPDGRVQQYAAIISDITQRKVDEEKILYQANYDQLTGLANRTLFMDRLTRLVVESKRAKTNVGLMFIDLDGFKAINDTLGHDAGDLLLKGCARRLEKCVRESDTVARLGGDEFTVIMPLIDSLEAAAVVAERIIRSLGEPFDLDGQEGRVSGSIGISVLPAQASDASSLLHNADVAMYHAKHSGKANFQFYSPDLEAGGAST